ncbi:MAG: YtxH domain-containing protein [Candidatus Gracilibacteria bacterium]
MSWFDPKKEEKPEKKSMLDKIIMGAIIGTAVGSVIGLAVAPKKGKDTREFLKEQLKEGREEGKKLIEKGMEEFEENKAELEEVGKLTKETVFGIGRLLKHLVLRKKTTQAPTQEHRAGLKEVPKETPSEIRASTLDINSEEPK